MSVFNEGIVFA